MDSKPTRILLVEDNPGDAVLLQEALREKEASPYQLERVSNLHDGLDRLSKGGLDLILLDLFLPDSSGFTTLQSVLKAASQVPIVVLTGLGDKETAMKSMQEGAQDFLSKDGLNSALLDRSIRYSIERYALLRKLQEEEERYSLAAEGAHDGLWDWNLRSGRVYFSSRWKLMLGYSEEEIGDTPAEWFSRVHPRDIERVKRDLSKHLCGKTGHFASEHRLRHKDGRYRWVLSRGLAISGGWKSAARIAGSFTDITRYKNMEQQLALRAFYDPMTGLPNRALFMDSLERAFSRLNRRPSGLFAVFFLDLDRLKFVNDTYGHQAGDALLVEFSKRLRSEVRPHDLVARIGGDEFTVLMDDLRERSEAVDAADRILGSTRTPFQLLGKEVLTTVSIGIAYSDCGKTDPVDFLKAADSAMYRAKVLGKGRYVVFKSGFGPDGYMGEERRTHAT